MAGELTKYRIYRLQSPSGRQYIGLTKTSVWQRWRGHVKRARTGVNHPLYNAIRKYGEDAFTVAHIACAVGKANAQALERVCIAQVPQGQQYNLSPGGEADGETAAKVFWDRMRADPTALAAYRAKLVEAQKVRVVAPAAKQRQLDGTKKWREDNPKATWKNAYRASRIARAKSPAPQGKPTRAETWSLKERLLLKHKGRAPRIAANTARHWAALSENARGALIAKIADGQRRQYAEGPERHAAVASQLSKARAGIDRAHQAARASAGQKEYWARLKADPERYAEHIARRVATLKRTNEERKNAKNAGANI